MKYQQGHGSASRRVQTVAARCLTYWNKRERERERPSTLRRVRGLPFGLGAKEKTWNLVWFLVRMKCPTLKSSGELSSAHPTSVSTPTSRTLLYHLPSLLDSRSGWPNHRGTTSTTGYIVRVRESLSSHGRDIYRGYALIRQELPSIQPASHLGTAATPFSSCFPCSSRLALLDPLWRPSSFLTSAPTEPSAFGDSRPLPLSSSTPREDFCAMCAYASRITCERRPSYRNYGALSFSLPPCSFSRPTESRWLLLLPV